MRKRGQAREKEDEEAVASVMKSMLDKIEAEADYETGRFQLPSDSNVANKVLVVFNQELFELTLEIKNIRSTILDPNFPLKFHERNNT